MEGLYKASLRGDVKMLTKLLNENPGLPLDEKFTGHRRTPLHMAAMCGHVKFAEELLRRNSQLTMVQDSHGFTPLHLASARPSLPMVMQLLDSDNGACMVQDDENRTPLHIAATEDRVNIIKTLIAQNPEAIHIRNGQNETILHLCIKHDSLNALKLLAEELLLLGAPTSDIEAISINSKNLDGNTVFHLAAEMRRMKYINFLVESNIGIDVNILNNEGVKALHMLTETVRNNLKIGSYDMNKEKNASQIWLKEKVNALVVVATLVAGIAFQAAMNPPGGVFQENSKIEFTENPFIFTYYLRSVSKSTKYSSRPGRYLDQQQLNLSRNFTDSDSFLIDMLKILDADTYRSHSVMGKSPGIVLNHEQWNKVISKYKLKFSPYIIQYAGTPVLAYKNPRIYALYMTYNAIAFLVSVMTIVVLVISGFDSKSSTNHQVRVLIGMMIVSVTAWLLSFITVFLSMSTPFYINHPLLNQAFIISIATLVVCISGYNLIKVKHWIKILWWKIMRTDRLIDQFQREYSALDSDHHIRLMSKEMFLRFMPVFYFILLATLLLPYLYG